MIHGRETILLDMEDLVLISDSRESQEQTRILEPQNLEQKLVSVNPQPLGRGSVFSSVPTSFLPSPPSFLPPSLSPRSLLPTPSLASFPCLLVPGGTGPGFLVRFGPWARAKRPLGLGPQGSHFLLHGAVRPLCLILAFYKRNAIQC